MNANIIYVNRTKKCVDQDMLGHILIPEQRMDKKWIMRKFSTIELPWKDNAKRISAIPDGKYSLIKRRMGRRFYEKYKSRFGHDYVCQIADVPGRTAVLIHIGNWASKDSHGCILIGYPAKNRREGQVPMIENSTPAYKIFYDLVDRLFETQGELQIIVNTMGDDKCSIN